MHAEHEECHALCLFVVVVIEVAIIVVVVRVEFGIEVVVVIVAVRMAAGLDVPLKDAVCLGELLELCCCFDIALIFVRMETKSELLS